MKQHKTNGIDSEMSIQKKDRFTFLKGFVSIMLIQATILFNNSICGQNKNDTIISVYSATENTYSQILDYSRPSKYHQLLADLVGSWTFKGKHYEWTDSVNKKVSLEFSGSVVRESFANGRYFVVNVTSDGTLEMPVQDGKMVETKFHGLDIEGYDNVKKKFVKTAIGNHLYSGLNTYEGVYDSTKRAIAFNSEFEPLPGVKTKDSFLFIFIDKNHYNWEYFQEENGKFRLGTEINFTRVTGN